MKGKARALLRLALLMVCAAGLVMTLRQQLHKSAGERVYAQAQQLASGGQQQRVSAVPEETVPAADAAAQEAQLVWMPEEITDDEQLEALETLDLQALQRINPQVVGWIRIPGTMVDYPIVQGQDNDYYLDHSWEGTENVVGSIYMEYQNSPQMTDYNTLIYGHNMRDGSMFADIRKYMDPEFYAQRPYIYILVEGGALRYEIFSSYCAEVGSAAYSLSLQNRTGREEFLALAMESSAIETGVEPGIRDRILTLSTCSGFGYNNRWVVHARLKLVETAL